MAKTRFTKLELFRVVRIPEGRKGKDKPDDLFGVKAIGHPDLVQRQESEKSAVVTGFSSRAEAKRLVDKLNLAYHDFHMGL